jgi:hypothetical protein
VLADGDIIQLGEHKLLYRDMRGMALRELVEKMTMKTTRTISTTMTSTTKKTKTAMTTLTSATRKRSTRPAAEPAQLERARCARRFSQTTMPAATLPTPTIVQINGQYQ